MTRRTLVVHTGGVGDFICTLPALRQLAMDGPIDIAGIPERVALAQAAGIAESIHDLDATGFHSVFSSPDARLQAFAQGYGRAIVWMEDRDGTLTRNLTAAGIPEVRCLPGIPPEGCDIHATQWYAQSLGVTVDGPVLLDFGTTTTANEIILQPGSGSPRKNWPLDRFQQLADSLTSDGYRVAWCLGPAEEDVEHRAPTLPPMHLTDLARVLAGARLFIGNDSGISHLASVTGRPTIAIFGPTDPAVWRPAGPSTTVVHETPWPLWETVRDTARDILDTTRSANHKK